jgi:hypothetical protein
MRWAKTFPGAGVINPPTIIKICLPPAVRIMMCLREILRCHP